MQIELTPEQMDEITIENLRKSFGYLKDKSGPPFFSYDKKVEKKYKKEMKRALKIVIAWYSVGGDVEGVIDGDH